VCDQKHASVCKLTRRSPGVFTIGIAEEDRPRRWRARDGTVSLSLFVIPVDSIDMCQRINARSKCQH